MKKKTKKRRRTRGKFCIPVEMMDALVPKFFNLPPLDLSGLPRLMRAERARLALDRRGARRKA